MTKRHSYLFLVVLVLAMLSFLVACDNKSTPPHEHTFADKLIHNETHHWYPATCEHTDEVKDKAKHTWDAGVEKTPAGYGVEGEKTYTCTACGRTRTESIAPIPPMTTGSIKFADGYTLDKTYDNEPISIDKSNVVRVVDGVETPIDNPDAISFLFKQFDADDSTYEAKAHKKPGHYMVKVIVAASPEWTEKEFEQGFYIDKIKLSGEYDIKNTLEYRGESHLISELKLTHEDLPCILEDETVIIKDIRTNKNAGRLEVASYTIVENEYYDDLDLPDFKLYATVNPFNISADIITKKYDGTVNAEFTGWGATIPEADRGKLTLNVTADGKDVGTHSPTNGLPVVFYLDGASTNNYTIDKSKIKVNVTAKALTFVTPPTKVFDGSNRIINVEKENLVGIANSENISVEIDTKKSYVIDPTQTPTGYSYVIKDNGNITKNYTITDSELHKARIVAKEVDFLPSYNFKVTYDKVKQWKLDCRLLFGDELGGYCFIVNYNDVNAGSAYVSHYFEKGSTTSYNYKLTSDAERIVTTSTIQKSKLELTQTAYNIQKSSSKSCYFVLYDRVEKEHRAIKCTYGPSDLTYNLINATFEPGNNYEVVVPNNAQLIFKDISGNYEMNVGETKDFPAESNNYSRDIKLNGVVEGTEYSIIVTCSSSAGSYSRQRKTVFSVDSSGITIQRLYNQNQTQTDCFTATGSGTYYLRISNLNSSTASTVTIQKVK